jgi:hypothetical protein
MLTGDAATDCAECLRLMRHEIEVWVVLVTTGRLDAAHMAARAADKYYAHAVGFASR